MSDTITNTTNTNESKVFNVYVSKSTTAGTALVTRGSLNKTDTAPTVAGLYVLEEIGIYPNLGNINAQSGKLNFASFDGSTWSLIAVDTNIDLENFIEGNIQIVGTVSNGTEDPLDNEDDYVCNLPQDKITEDRYLKSVELNLKNSGKIVFSILNHNATNNTISLDRNFEFDFVDGYNKFEFFNEKILQGQIFAINRILSTGSNAKLYFSGNSGQMLTQYKNDGTIRGQLADTVYNYKLTTSKNYTDNLIELISSNFAIKSEIADLKNPFKLENESSYGSAKYDLPFGELPQSEWYLEKLNFSNKKYIKNIKMYALTAGNITFAFGLIDQHNIFIPLKEFSFTTIANQINTYDFNEILRENGAIAIKLPTHGMTWKTKSAGAGKLWYSSYGGVLTAQTDFNMAWVIGMADYVENTIAFKSEIEPLKNDIISLQNKPFTLISPNGTPYKLSVDNNGNLIAKSQIFGKITHLGNSICKHPITSFWWGFWGMAATVRENDYVHRFLAKYQTINAGATTEALNIADWEINHTTYNKTNIDSTIDGSDLIVVKIGENVTYSTSFKDEFRNLINYIIGKEPQATILIGGTFWYHAEKDADMKSIADELGITFVSMQGLDTPSNRATLSTQVYGDDNQWHTISDGGSIDQGVADHPSDAGMEAIAQRLFDGLGL